jgi:hypothetical protein
LINAGFKNTELRVNNGRAMELSLTTVEQMQWSLDDEEVRKHWDQVKNAKESQMIHQPEVDLEENWALCWYVWFALFLLHGAGASRYLNPFTTQEFVHSDLQVLNWQYMFICLLYCFSTAN